MAPPSPLDLTPTQLALAPWRHYPVRAEASLEISAPIERVWAALTEVNDWPRWMSRVARVKPTAALALGRPFDWKADGVWIRSTPLVVQAPHQLLWTGQTIGTRALHLWQLEATALGTRVTTLEGLGGLLPSVFRHSFQGKLEGALQDWLLQLSAVVRPPALPLTAGEAWRWALVGPQPGMANR